MPRLILKVDNAIKIELVVSKISVSLAPVQSFNPGYNAPPKTLVEFTISDETTWEDYNAFLHLTKNPRLIHFAEIETNGENQYIMYSGVITGLDSAEFSKCLNINDFDEG